MCPNAYPGYEKGKCRVPAWAAGKHYSGADDLLGLTDDHEPGKRK